ncbi:MAG TPA: class I SAM-dependent methyltransferase, partial [Polyangia bacterium]|nr:class I SAM-dependent methyltransferase [Polyangia bacterium]
AQRGVRVTGVDWSPVAVEKARDHAARDPMPPSFVISDVTCLDGIAGPFDLSFDVGCFHCLDAAGQRRYAAAVARVLTPGGTHLIWAIDDAPSDLALSPALIEAVFAPGFTLADARKSRRRLTHSHWYWLSRRA